MDEMRRTDGNGANPRAIRGPAPPIAISNLEFYEGFSTRNIFSSTTMGLPANGWL